MNLNKLTLVELLNMHTRALLEWHTHKNRMEEEGE